tara:strand:+ start:2045 stop:5104 length:3060 start_codon:yes stop_codon:yes gene_type:complete
MIVDEYLELTKKYKNEYGDKTLVLMQVGSFFEAYGIKDNENKIIGSDIDFFAEINDMTVTQKANVFVGKKKVVMAGFGLPQLEKYVKKMQDTGYTIVVYTQDIQGKNTTRSLYAIYSPGTYFSNDSQELSNNTTCIWLHTSKNLLSSKSKINITVGISNIDIYTGKVSIFEFSKPYLHNPSTFDELERYISIYNPSETILISNLSEAKINDIINFASINSNKIHIITSENKEKDKLIKNAEKQIYQKEVIEKFYPINNSNIILNNLQNYCIAIQSFVFLLDFIYKHNPNLVKKLNEPIIENLTERLLLGNHSLKQLNIISDNRSKGKNSCLSNLLNNCITPMGKREFNYNLLNPITNIKILNESYDITEHLLKNNWMQYKEVLSKIKDMEKLRRKLILKKISPKDFNILNENLKSIFSLYELVKKDEKLVNYLKETIDLQDFEEIKIICEKQKENIEYNLNLQNGKWIDDISQEKLGNWDIKKLVYINLNLSENIDKYYKLSIESEQKLECIRKYFSDLIQKTEKATKSLKNPEYVKINETAKSDPTLQATKRRVTFLKKEIDLKREKNEKSVELTYMSNYSEKYEKFNLDISDINYQVTSGNGSTMVITSSQIKEINSSINTAKNNLISSLERYYNDFTSKIIEENFNNLIKFISELDILQCKCFLAKEFNYCKPIIKDESNDKSNDKLNDESNDKSNKSFLSFYGIRHPLVENLNTKELYITNDLDLSETLGILLYGTNAVGKTCLIKAIGISIIMAQAGLYVPASEFSYYPYKSIFTRILGHDNIFKGLSTFAVEMLELRTILNLSDKNSLILGDELCSGTENDSALSIFVSGLEMLHEKGSTFLFATHFHEIVGYEEIENLDKLKMFHMTVIYDKNTDKLVYNRKLQEGAGDSMYGLEVCKSLDLPETFLERAHNLRIKYNKSYINILDLNPSKYNSKKLKGGICELCKIRNAQEVHHLEYQMNSKNGFIKTTDSSFKKDHVANLINICEICHDNIHRNKTRLKKTKVNEGYKLQ